MKKLLGNTGVKIAAVILSYVMIFFVLLSATAVGIMGYYKFYFSDEPTVTREILSDMALREANYTNYLLEKDIDVAEYYKDKNIYYEIKDLSGTGKYAYNNYNGESYYAVADCEYIIYNDVIYKQDESGTHYTTEENLVATIKIYIAKDMQKNDIFSLAVKAISFGFKLRYTVILIFLISLTLFITVVSYLFCAAGHSKDGKVKLNYFDKLPIDIYICVLVIVGILGVSFLDSMFYSGEIEFIISALFVASVYYFLILGFFLSVATRIKTATFLRNSLIYRILKFLKIALSSAFRRLKYIISNLNLIKKSILFIIVGVILEIVLLFIVINAVYSFDDEVLLFFIIPINLVVIFAVLYLTVILQKIKTGGEKIAKGILDFKIDTEFMFGDFKEFSESLNDINTGLQTALNEKMKSEHFKTELITNVSHDIKTPLTSIINYTDLLKKEEIDNHKAKEYISVLDRQSERLKKLVDDLVEASKASSGSLSVNLNECNINVLINQTVGEYEERLLKSNIIPVKNFENEDIKILADGRHLWRVFDNLLNNVCKYAMPNTRIYIDTYLKDENVYITFKNVSKYELNISSNELMERFVRGDRSRHTEGSGLGLSIAKSLTELQGGNFNIDIDGDLFKIIISFDKI